MFSQRRKCQLLSAIFEYISTGNRVFQIVLNGCVNLTEFSLKSLLVDGKGNLHLKNVGLVAAAVKVVPKAVEGLKQVLLKLNGCPLIKPYGTSEKPETNDPGGL